MQFAQAINRAADFAIRVIDLLQRILDALDGVFDQFHQSRRGIGFQQFRQ